MASKEYNGFVIEVGSDFSKCLTLKDPSTGNPFDLTGDTFELQLLKNAKDEDVDAVMTLNLTSGIQSFGASGKVLFSLTNVETETLRPHVGRLYYRFRRVSATSGNKILLKGTVKIV